MGFSTAHLVIVLAIVILIFGTGKIAGLGKSVGTAINEFKTALKPEDKSEDKSNDSTKKEA